MKTLFGRTSAFTLAALGLPLALVPNTASATEGAASVYVLGTGVPGAGASPPLEGVYFDDTIYVYNGSAAAGKQFVIGGNVVADIEATVVADFLTTLWVPSTNFAGGTLAVGVTLPVGAPMIDAGVTVTGPGGAQIGISRHDSTLVIGDPVVNAAVGWKSGKTNIRASTMLNVPVGHYREGQLANLAFHRWAVDTSLAISWIDPAAGWDVSGKAGVTFNGRNDYTKYHSGDEFHFEGAAEKSFSPKFSAGVLGYYFTQISGDSGTGARLGAFKGEVAGLGVTAATNIVMGRSPATFRLRATKEFGARNRLEGTSVLLSLTLPLYMKMPTQ